MSEVRARIFAPVVFQKKLISLSNMEILCYPVELVELVWTSFLVSRSLHRASCFLASSGTIVSLVCCTTTLGVSCQRSVAVCERLEAREDKEPAGAKRNALGGCVRAEREGG